MPVNWAVRLSVAQFAAERSAVARRIILDVPHSTSDFRTPGRRMSFLTTHARFQFGKANTTRVPPRGRPLLPPPAEMTTYCRPLTM